MIHIACIDIPIHTYAFAFMCLHLCIRLQITKAHQSILILTPAHGYIKMTYLSNQILCQELCCMPRLSSCACVRACVHTCMYACKRAYMLGSVFLSTFNLGSW